MEEQLLQGWEGTFSSRFESPLCWARLREVLPAPCDPCSQRVRSHTRVPSSHCRHKERVLGAVVGQTCSEALGCLKRATSPQKPAKGRFDSSVPQKNIRVWILYESPCLVSCAIELLFRGLGKPLLFAALVLGEWDLFLREGPVCNGLLVATSKLVKAT